MPIKRDDYDGVRLVIFRLTWNQLCAMANVETRATTVDGKSIRLIMPVAWRSEQTFWVCATMLLGNADAMMLAQISRPGEGELKGEIWFEGLEVV